LAVFISHSNKPRFDHLFQAYINELIIQGKRAKKSTVIAADSVIPASLTRMAEQMISPFLVQVSKTAAH